MSNKEKSVDHRIRRRILSKQEKTTERVRLGRLDRLGGDLSEEKVQRTVEKGIQNGNLPHWVYLYRKATIEDDRWGIDGWIESGIGDIPLQVKRSFRDAYRFRKRRPDIEVIIVPLGSTIDQTLKKLSKIIYEKGAKQSKF